MATIAQTTGLVTAQSVGTAVISVELDGFNHQQTLTVSNFSVDSISITPLNPTGIIGTTTQLYATAFLSDGSTQDITNSVSWSSSNSSVASVSNVGRVSPLTSGSVTITAQLGALSAQTSFSVSNLTISSIAITSLGSTLSVGFQQNAKAIATLSNGSTLDVSEDTTWSVTDAAVASISNSTPKGKVAALSLGSTTIKAQLGNLQTTQIINVSNATLSSISLVPNNIFL